MKKRRDLYLLAAVVLLTAAGAIMWPWYRVAADTLWVAAAVIAVVPAVAGVIADLRARRWGADLLAVLALVSAPAVGEFLAGAVIAVMVATGQVLESAAGRRAARDLSALLDRAPSRAHRRRGEELETVPIGVIATGDTVVVLPGEIVPADGTLLGEATFDESALTGESALVTRATGDAVRSGVVNAAGVAVLRVERTAETSTYAGVVSLAREAAAAPAPVARLADRIAAWFLPVAVALALVAWAVGGAVRAVAVLVTATPCPLLLAVPIAVTGGLSRASRRGVIVKDGAALELLGQAGVVVTDKTGTITEGRPELIATICAPGVPAGHALSLAAAVETYSTHVLAGAITRAARRAGITPSPARDVTEEVGRGVSGFVDGHEIRVGRLARNGELPAWGQAALRRGELDLASLIWVHRDGEPVAVFLVRDRIRPDAARTLRRLRAAGPSRIVALTGDRVANADEVAGLLGLDDVQAEATPADKVARVRAEREHGVTVMVGDGVNDAPALAAADVGVALGSGGTAAAAEAADAVILDDRIDGLADAVEIARRSRRLAVGSAVAGTVLSLAAMGFAAAGLLVPIAGAVVQEGIDVAVILNALRSLWQPKRRAVPGELLRRFSAEHAELLPVRLALRQAADAVADGVTPAAEAVVRDAYARLVAVLLPHEHAEETELYPRLWPALGGPETTMTMSRTHAEIDRLVRRLGRHLAETPLRADQLDDLRATLYGLDAVLTLHFAQEEESYFSLAHE